MTALLRRSTKTSLLALIGVSVAGTVDVAEFLATRTAMFTDAPGRAAGSVFGLALWVALIGIATTRYVRGERRGASAATLGLAIASRIVARKGARREHPASVDRLIRIARQRSSSWNFPVSARIA